jgi:anti-anti-sigma factor
MNGKTQIIHLPDIFNEICAANMRQEITQHLESGSKDILLDLSETKFIDSSGLGTLALTYKSVQAQGGQIYLCSVGTQPRMLFELTGMEEIFEIYPDQTTFFNSKTLEQSNV